MAEMSANTPILYHYAGSPYGRRIVWYLTLRGIQYAQVKQPPILPRPDLEAIGVKYRRIPLMVIGKDVYADTRVILAKLESLFPGGKLGGATPETAALEHLLEVWHVEAGLFARSAGSMPSSLPMLRDPKFAKDRAQFSGRPWSKKAIDKNRPENLVYVQNAFHFLETVLLADGRTWVSKGDRPALADIQAVWCISWLDSLKVALPSESISEKLFPLTYALMRRFDKYFKEAKSAAPKPIDLTGEAAAKHIFNANFFEADGDVSLTDMQKLKKGDVVEVYPTDSGFSHKDRGELIGLNANEIIIQLESGLRLHTPRIGFRVRKVDAGQGTKL